MANPAVEMTVCKCAFGAAPLPLEVSSQASVKSLELNVATIMDNRFQNFGMCSSPTNPAVIAATEAKLGVFTPAPCTPAIPAPWVPGAATVLVCGKPLLNDSSKLICINGGVIQVTKSPATTVETP
ncbi:MAG: DUF4280 domain-containing protein [Oscillospiraceae bacterium]|nr:DUF4280 domain-containing protein [Oscillospiraceae bacterium]